MKITVLPPDPRLQGWPVPVGYEMEDLPGWLCRDGIIMGSYLTAARAGGWTAVGFNCFQKHSTTKFQ